VSFGLEGQIILSEPVLKDQVRTELSQNQIRD